METSKTFETKSKSTSRYVWQYKNSKEGWSNFDNEAIKFIESVYPGYLANQGDTDTSVRSVKSGDWEYQVDFMAMKQTNTQHEDHKIRDIRRVCRVKESKAPAKAKDNIKTRKVIRQDYSLKNFYIEGGMCGVDLCHVSIRGKIVRWIIDDVRSYTKIFEGILDGDKFSIKKAAYIGLEDADEYYDEMKAEFNMEEIEGISNAHFKALDISTLMWISVKVEKRIIRGKGYILLSDPFRQNDERVVMKIYENNERINKTIWK
jgi:hypothetical protein